MALNAGDVYTRLELRVDDQSFARGDVRLRKTRLEADNDAVLHVKVDVDQRGFDRATQRMRSVASESRRTDRDLQRFGSTVGGIGGALGGTIGRLDDFNVSLGFVTGRVGNLAVAAAGLGPVLLAVSGAVIALSGSLAAAAAGVGALGVGLAATFAPAALLAVGVVTRLTAITKVYQAQQQATLADQVKAGKVTAQHATSVDTLASAMDGLRNSNMAVGDSRRQLTKAEEDYGTAVQQAENRIADARDREVAAAHDVTKAQRELAQARTDAQRALEDAQRASEDSALNEADAIARRNELTASGDTSSRSYFDAQRAVAQATTEAARAHEDNAAFVEKGVMAFRPLQDALANVAAATKTYHLREKELIAIEDQGIRNSPVVVAATDRIRTAREQLTRSVRAQQAAERQLRAARAAGDGSGPAAFDTGQAKAGALAAQLDPVERGLLATGRRIIKTFRDNTKDAVDAIFSGLERGVQRFPAALHELRPDLTELGRTLGGITDEFLHHLTGPEWMSAWHQFAAAANPVMKDLSRVFTDGFDILRDIAIAVLPDLKSVLGDTADGADRLQQNIHKALLDGHLGDVIHGFVTSFRDWTGLIGQVGLLLGALLGGGKKDGDDMVVSLTHIVKHWRAWIDANPDKVRKFFRDARDLISNIAQIVGPVAKAFVEMWGLLFKVGSEIPTSVWHAIGLMFAGLAIAKFTGAITLLRLMSSLVGKKLPSMPAGSGLPGAPGGGGARGPGGAYLPGETRPTVPGGPTGGPRDARARAGRGRFGEDFRYGAPESQIGQVRGDPGARFGGAGGIATIAALVATELIPANSKVGRVLFGPGQSGDPRKDQLALSAVQGSVQQAVGHHVADDLKSINAAVDELIRGGESGKLRQLQKALADAFGANKNTDLFNPRLLQVYSDAVGRAADSAAGKLRAQNAEQRRVAKVAAEVDDDVIRRWQHMAERTGASVSDMRKTVAANSAEIKLRLGADSEAGARALNHNFDDAVGWVRTHMTRAGKLTRDGMAEIERLLRAHLADFGITGKQADTYIRGTAAGGASAFHAGDPVGNAAGGWIGQPGERGGDNVRVALPEGAAVYNWVQQPIVDMARRMMGGALFASGGMVDALVGRGEYAAWPGEAKADDHALRSVFGMGLADLFDATSHTRHYQPFASGGQAERQAVLRSLNRRFPAHSLGNAAGHFRMTPDDVVMVAQAEGLPGRPFEQIAHGESQYYPGIVEADEGGGVRGYGLFQNTTKVNGPAFEHVIAQLGGWLEQLNPVKAAKAARWLYDRGGLSHWHGTRFLGAVSSAVQAGPGRATTAVQAAISKLRVPGLRAGTALDGILSGAMRGGVRGANAVLGRVAPIGVGTPGPAGGPSGTAMFEGRPVAKWIIPELMYARAHGWTGPVTSGYRTPAKSAALGFPGDQHTKTQYPGGAVDFGGMVDPAGAANRSAFERATIGYTGRRLLEPINFRDDGHMSGTGSASGGFIRRFAGGGTVTKRGGTGRPSRLAAQGRPVTGGRPAQIADVGFANLYGDLLAGGGSAGDVGSVDEPPASYVALVGDLKTLTNNYSLEDRRYGQITSELIDANTGAVNEAAINERVGQLMKLRAIREAIVAKIQEMIDRAHAIIAAHQEVIRRLQLAMPFSTTAVQVALQGEIAQYQTQMGQWGDKIGDLGFDKQNAELDLTDTDNIIASVKGTQPGSASAASSAPSALDVATAAFAQFTTFKTAAEDAFRSFGSNAVQAGMLGRGGEAEAVAGLRNFGAVQDTAPRVNQVVNVTISDANDTHVFTKSALHDLQAAIG